MPFILTILSLLLATRSDEVPETSLSVRKTGLKGCGPPDFECVKVMNRTTPKPKRGEVLIKVSGSSMNPDEVSILKIPLVQYSPGLDVSGTVAALGQGVTSLKVGDRVWTMFATGGMAEYTTRLAALTGIVPDGLDLGKVGTLPTVAMTTLGALQSAGAPWSKGSNVTVLITAGTGGTGYVAVQLAKALGAACVVTAASPENLDFARSLGADTVVNYHNESVFDAVANGSVDVVFNNHGSDGNGDRAMPKLRPSGGIFVTIAGGMAKNPPAGIKQIDYSLWDPREMLSFRQKLDTLAGFLSDSKMRVDIQETFDLEHAKDAFTLMASGHIRSKISVLPRLEAPAQRIVDFTV